MELAIAVAVTVLGMLIPLRMVNIRRMRGWAARDMVAIAAGDAALASIARQDEAQRRSTDAFVTLKREHAEREAASKAVADRVLANHDWHIGGKDDPHGRGVLVRYECAGCSAVTHAPEGSL